MQRASAGTDGSHTKRSWFDDWGGSDCQLVFAKGSESRNVALEFLEFVTDRRFLGFVTLGDFRKARICGGSAIRYFHSQGKIQSCDIKYLASAKEKAVISEEKFGRR